ncbi:MAG: M23 family metallopeptidase [Candidatus Pacearchaeota archaeon]|nr:MAG: M23 family metallopeptidase [Candidatus Pacearchaeota archaeon]
MRKMKKINLVLAVLLLAVLFSVLMVSVMAQQPPIVPPAPELPLEQIQTPPEFYMQEPPTPYLYPNAGVTPWSHVEWREGYCNKTGMDFLIEIAPDACQPAIVTSDLLEEQDVPVLCRMTGIKINPIIQVPYIKRIIPAVENRSDGISYVNFLPARYALSYYGDSGQKKPGFEGVPTMSNLGYLLIVLKRQPSEKKMPESVKADISVRIIYDIARTYGINENQFVLPLLSQEEWITNYKNYGFWRGKGYLRLQEIEGNNRAKVALYTIPSAAPFATRDLRVGIDPTKKDEVMLPGFYCGAGVSLRLDEISIPKNRIRLLVNGNELLLGEGERIQDSGCVVFKIEPSPYTYGGSAVIRCAATDRKVLTLSDIEADIKVDEREERVSVGSRIVAEKDNKKNYFYVGYLGKEYLKEGMDNFMILFSGKNAESPLSEGAVKKTTETIHSYIKSLRGEALEALPSTTWNLQLREALQKIYPDTARQVTNFYVSKKGVSNGIGSLGTKINIIDMRGPKQVLYSSDVEAVYKDAIQHYRDIAHAYSVEQHPEGMYYGVMALSSAADLASELHKEIDEVDLLRELIDKYSDSSELEIIAEVEEARERLRRVVSLSGDNSAMFSRPSGNYFMQMVSVEKPSLAVQSAEMEINDVRGTYGIDDIIDGWQIEDITDIGVVFKNLTKTSERETVSIGKVVYFGQTRVKVLDITIKREAKVTILPFERERETETNFSIQIGIEKRAIQLSPEKTREMIAGLDKTISKFESVRDKLGDVVSVWKKACYVGASALWVKNFVTGLSGEALARKKVMQRWTIICSDEGYRKSIGAVSISDCYRIKEDAINKDINLMKNSLSKANSFVKDVKESEGVTKTGGLFGLSKTVDENEFMKVANKTFSSELKGIGDIHQQKQLRKIAVSDGPIIYQGKRYESINKLIEDIGIQTFEERKNEYAEIENRFVNTAKITENISYLHQKSQLFKNDIKELHLTLEIYNECKKKTQSDIEDSALCKEALTGTYGKLSGYANVLEEGTAQEALKDVLGLDAVVVVPEKRNIIKSPIYTLKNFPKLQPKLEESGDTRFTYFYHTANYYIAVVESTGDGKFAIKTLYNIEKLGTEDIKVVEKFTSPELSGKLGDLGISHVEEIDITLCNNNEIKNPYRNEIKFWETGPYKDFVALMPIDRRTGWYLATTYTGLEGALVAWKESGDINVFWICNVGQDGIPNFDFSQGASGDDCCTQVALITGAEPEIPPLTASGSREIVKRAKDCAKQAITDYSQGKRRIETKCGDFVLAKPPSARPAMQCEDFMSPSDCRIMFNLCDPVMCPSSRCDLGGRMPVDDVVASGVIGSLMLCLPNWEDGRGVLVPICLTGVHAGLDNFITILKSGRDCLQEQLETGKTIGICDEIMSIYKCEFFWRQLDPFIRAGIPALTESFTGRGGGEYALFSESWKQGTNALRYWSDYYEQTSNQAFKARSTAQIGTEICKRFISGTYPTQAQFWEQVSKPESPTQAMAWFDETQMGGPSPESHYKVFFHIFAGRDQGVYYSVYLRSPSAPGYYQPPPQYMIPNGFGYLPAGEYISMTPDFTAPSGYKEVCIRLNEKEICGFGQATTNFAIEELQNYYLKKQAAEDVSTAQECVSGKPTIIPTATLNIQSAVEHALEPAIYRRGIIRRCSTLNPGLNTEPDRWKRIGYCDSESVGCWLDTKSVEGAVSDLGIREDIMEEAEQKNIAHAIEKYGYDKLEDSQSNLIKNEPKILDIEKTVTEFINKVNLMIEDEFKAEKKDLEKEIENIDKIEIQPLIITFREISKKCARSEEKARADWAIAKILGLRARLYALPGIYEVEKKLKEEEIPVEIRDTLGLLDWPVPLGYDIISYYGEPRFGYEHTGIDIGGAGTEGYDIVAAASGKIVKTIDGCKVSDCENCVTEICDTEGCRRSKVGKSGNMIVIEHEYSGRKIYSLYMHLKENSVVVKVGDNVKRGEKIAEVGKTGNACGTPPHLHFEVRLKRYSDDKNPLCFFSAATLSKVDLPLGKYDAEECKKIQNEFKFGVEIKEIRECKNIPLRDQCLLRIDICYWDSADLKCRGCPDKCEGSRESFWDPFWNDPNLMFKTKNDCEDNNCALDCLWSDKDNKCKSISDEYVRDKVNKIDLMTADEIKKLKEIVERNKNKLSQADTWLSIINRKLAEIEPQITEIILYSSVNNGDFDRSNKLVDYDDRVEICAVLEIGGKLYSGRSLSTSIKGYEGPKPIFRWYNIIPYYQPEYGDSGETYELYLYEGGRKDLLQYSQQQISGNDWCVYANGNVGTYQYRVETDDSSSLGRAATLADKIEYERKYMNWGINFNKYDGYWHTLLQPAAVKTAGISTDVHRISRKSDARTCIEKDYSYYDKRCRFIATLESFKNVPFAYGCAYYEDEQNKVEHLAKNFVAIDCINLMIGALDSMYPDTYEFSPKIYFDDFIRDYTTIKYGIEKWPLESVLGINMFFDKDEELNVEPGDILFVWREGKGYTHTFVIYEDKGEKGIFDEDDIMVYASRNCPGSEPKNKESKILYNGQLCYAPIGRYKDDPNFKFTLVKIKNLE